jgi:hypothetical protein
MIAALMIFSTSVLAVVEVFGLCMRSTGTVRDYSRAVLLAQGLMEEALAEQYLLSGQESGQFEQELPEGSWEREIVEADEDGLYQVRVTVTWSDRGHSRMFELTTLAAER